MSGGGSSVIIIPVLLWLGIPFPVATAGQKVSATCWVLPAGYNYLRDRKINWKFLLLMSGLGLVGVYFGVQFVVGLDTRVLQIIIGVLILILVLYILLNKKLGVECNNQISKLQKILAYPIALVIGFYESIFGSGNGILFSVTAVKTQGFDFQDALGYYYFTSFFWSIATASILLSKGYFDLSITLPILAGSLIGGYIGSRYAKYRGNRFIKIMFACVGTLLAVKLLAGV